MTTVKRVLDFWFSGLTDNQPIDKKSPTVKRWFIKDQKFDTAIKAEFEDDLTAASSGEYKSWEDTAQGRLALVIFFDQFSRNIYRNTPKMFATDPLALKLALHSIKEQDDNNLQLIERLFFYMPLMHAEDLEIQKLSVKCFENFVRASQEQCPNNTSYFEYNLTYAQKHLAIIERFGRFPHRNSILGRNSSREELEFLNKPNSSF